MLSLPTAFLRSAVLLVTSASLLACSSRGDDARSKRRVTVTTSSDRAEGAVRVSLSGHDKPSGNADGKPTFTTGDDGSATIHSRNGAFFMALRHDSVVVGFSDSLRQAIRHEVSKSMSKDTSSSSAFGEAVKEVVKTSVGGAMREVFDKARGFPVSTLRDVRYEAGAIQFDFAQKPRFNFLEIDTDGEPLTAQFHPADAARFVGAVRASMKRS